jgi:cell filamentation protein
LKGLNAKEFSKRTAYYLAEINMIHPFREGNGRSIREYIRQLALNCGYVINWSLVEKETLLNATIAAVDKNYEPLSNCIFEVIENK